MYNLIYMEETYREITTCQYDAKPIDYRMSTEMHNYALGQIVHAVISAMLGKRYKLLSVNYTSIKQ